MTKIYEILNDNDSVLAFDMDGVLSKLDFGEYNHFAMDSDTWAKACQKGGNFYTKNEVVKKMKNFIKKKNIDNIYVITKVYNEYEPIVKEPFLTKYYKIKKENIFYVTSNSDKVKALLSIKEKYPNLDDHKIAMIDDSTEVLSDIMSKTNFTTIHISSFID